jgi:hypothetical protein
MSIHRPKRVSYRSSRDVEPLDGAKESTVNWKTATEGKQPADFKPYSVKTTYAAGDLLQHPKFGNGVVVSIEPTKIDVLFEDGPRKLAHAMA